jgi:hypothetical protein
MNLKYLLILVFFSVFIGSVFASNWGIFYSNEDYYFEISSNGIWYQTNSPYSFYYDGFYYFDSPFRYYYNGSYNYYPSGWYDLGAWNYNSYSNSGAWTTPWNGNYNSYYSPYYYYWQYDWHYSPEWIPAYSYSYYNWTPSYSNWNERNSYYNSGDGIGNMYSYEQNSTCNEIVFLNSNALINAGETKTIEVKIKNNSDYYFYLSNASVYVDSWDVSGKIINFDKEIINGNTGKIIVELKAKENAVNENTFLRIKLNGRFSDTVNCSSDELQKKISLKVNGLNSNTNSGNQTAYSYSYYGNYDSYTAPGTWTETEFTETKNKTEKNTQEPELNNSPNPYLISLNTYSISVNSNESTYTTFILQNNSEWDLIVESVKLESHGNFSAGAKILNGVIVPAKGYSSIQINVNAKNVSKETISYGLLKVNARFSEGTPIYLEEGINVLIKKEFEKIELKEELETFELVVPKEIDSDSEFAIYLNNPFNSNATIYLNCENCELNKEKILIERNKKNTEIIKVLNAEKNARIIYSIRMSGKYFQNKLTSINLIENELKEEPEISKGFVSIQKIPTQLNLSEGFLKIELKNYSNEEKEILIDFENIQGNVVIESIYLILKANESKELMIPFKVNEFIEGKAEIVLLMNYSNGFESKEINFNELIEENNTEETKAQEENAMVSALVVLGNNALIGIILILLALIVFIAFKIKKNKEEEIIIMETK